MSDAVSAGPNATSPRTRRPAAPAARYPIALAAAVAALSALTFAGHAHAFGGLWSSRPASVQQSAAAILFVDNPDATVTAVVQLRYQGPPQEFVWLIPVPGTPTVGLSSSTAFARLDAVTAPQYWLEVDVKGECTEQAEPVIDGGMTEAPYPSSSEEPAAAVIEGGALGPYEYVTIELDPAAADPVKAATDWLSANGFQVTGRDRDALGPYLTQGFNLLALKLAEGKGAGALRPVMLTYASELPMIPLRAAALAAANDMGIRVWVIGPSQAVPDNYKSLVLNDARIDWLSVERFVAGTLPNGGGGPFGLQGKTPSNYAALVSAAADEAGGHGFVTELGGPASQYRERVWASVDDEQFASLANRTYAKGIDAVLTAQHDYGGWDGWNDAIEGATSLPEGVTLDEFLSDPEQYSEVAEVDASKFLQLLEEQVIRPVADTAALLYRAPYLTRLYSTLSPVEMTVDPAFNYNADLAQIANVHIARQTIQCAPELGNADAPWRVETPQGGVIAGEGRSWPVAEGSLPASLKIVMLSTRGSGNVIEDNSEAISKQLFDTAGISARSGVQYPHDGVLIGGSQSVVPFVESEAPPAARESERNGGGCSAAPHGSHMGLALVALLLLAGPLFARRRSR